MLRDRDTTGNGTLDERLYALQDGNWNVTAVCDDNGDVQERYAYTPYGRPLFLSPSFTSRSSSDFAWETLYCGYRYDTDPGLFHVRYRVYHPGLGGWLTRDPAGYAANDENLYRYVMNVPLSATDSSGKQGFWSDYWFYLTNPSRMDPGLRKGFYTSAGVGAGAGIAAGGLAIGAYTGVTAIGNTVIPGTAGFSLFGPIGVGGGTGTAATCSTASLLAKYKEQLKDAQYHLSYFSHHAEEYAGTVLGQKMTERAEFWERRVRSLQTIIRELTP